jgi:hypothetical protein
MAVTERSSTTMMISSNILKFELKPKSTKNLTVGVGASNEGRRRTQSLIII